MNKKQQLAKEIFNKVKLLISKYNDSYIKESDDKIMKQINQRLVSGGNKGYAFKIHCHYKEYTLYTCYGTDKLAEYISLISLSRNRVTLLGNFQFNNGLI